MDIEAINAALAAAADNVAGLNTAKWLPPAVNYPPLFCPVSLDFDPHQTFANGLTEMRYTCAIICSRGDQDAGRIQLASFLPPTGATSVIAALEADKTLGGAARSLVVDRVHSVNNLLSIGGSEYFSAELDVRVWAT